MDDGGPAFPTTPDLYRAHDDGTVEMLTFPGMSLRDWFAGQALAGCALDPGRHEFDAKAWAYRAYLVADAMLEARKCET